MSLPPGWGDRTNQMSEKDMQLGGVAATHFSSKQHQPPPSTIGDAYRYRSSDEVRQIYLERIKAEEEADEAAKRMAKNDTRGEGDASASSTAAASALTSGGAGGSVLPAGWEGRQKARELEAKQYGVFSSKASDTSTQQQSAVSTSMSLPKQQQQLSSSKTIPTVESTHIQGGGGKAGGEGSSTAEAVLVQVATHTLNSMSNSLERNPVTLSPDDRAAFAAAVKRSMDVLSQCR